ncbi:unnamed protein product [Closterium sp. Naga37s-1]|nr:unnamed protein product [Closterium sp. Naga37s-1]
MSSAARPRCFLDIAFDGKSVGRIEVEVRPDVAPKTVENFVGLCNGTSSGLGYKGLTLHRIIPGFMAQGGNCGSSIFGQPFPDESFELRHSGRGVLSMANRGPNTNNCQFFICFTVTPHLGGKHVTAFFNCFTATPHLDRVVFGKVVIDCQFFICFTATPHLDGKHAAFKMLIAVGGWLCVGAITSLFNLLLPFPLLLPSFPPTPSDCQFFICFTATPHLDGGHQEGGRR